MDEKENAPLGDSQAGRKANANNQKSKPKKYQNETKKTTYPPTTIEEAERALYCIPADCPEEEWKDSGMAFASEFPNDLAIFDAWSQQAPDKYNAADLKSRWLGRWASHSGKTIATLFYIAEIYGYKRSKNAAPLSAEQRARIERDKATRQAEAQRKAEQRAEDEAHAQQRAATQWATMADAPADHGYLLKKGIQNHSLKLFKGDLKIAGMQIDGCLMVPATDIDGTVKSLQFIHPEIPGHDGKKNLPQAPMKGLFWKLGDFLTDGHIYLAEGPATAASIHEASAAYTFCTFGKDNFLTVAKLVREPYPQAQIILCADNDPPEKLLASQLKAIQAAQAVNGLIALPNLDANQGKDFNDQHAAHGLESVRATLAELHTPEALTRHLLQDPATQDKTRQKLTEIANGIAPADPSSEAPAELETDRNQPADNANPNTADNDKAIIARLARLSAFDYERIRSNEADRLDVRPAVLDKEVYRHRARLAEANQEAQGSKLELYQPEPWPVEVNGAEVLNHGLYTIKRHMSIKEEYAIIVILWAVHTHLFDAFTHTPRLIITAPNAECGKSVLLYHLIGNLITRPLSAEDLTPPVFYRVIESHCPVLLIDECDTFFKQDSGMIGGINNGWEPHGGALRCVGDDAEVRRFSTYAPVAMAGIKLHKILPPATIGRSFVIILERALESEISEFYDSEKHKDRLLEIGRKIARWCADHKETLRQSRPTLPANARNRRADRWRSFFAIAETAGGDWPQKVLRAYLSEEQEDTAKLDTALQLLTDIRDVLKPDEHVIATAELIDRLCTLDESPWTEYNFKERDNERRKLQDRQISKLLKDYRIKPGTIRIGQGTPKGYKRVDFEIAWKRYLPATPATPPTVAATPPHSSNGAGYSESLSATTNPNVADKNPLEAAKNKDCGGVADEFSKKTDYAEF
ncbi:MAG: DUF3631 domain-containing protein [Proteobacteria bacterium]|nr:DUF3631 domain-containing protein [Pseudomonadota bacterium]